MAGKKLSATITIGGALSGTLGASVSAATAQLGKLNKAAYSQSYAIGDVLKKQQLVTKELAKQRSISAAEAGKKKGADMMGAGAVGLGIAGAVIGAAAFPVKAAVDFENAMLGVAKQVQGARDAGGHLTPVYFEMAKEIQALGRTIPMSTNALAEMAAAGARMDIPREQLIEFTRTAAMMAEAFQLPAGELADQMGKIQKLFGLKTQAEVRSLADSINYLDDNAISKGGDIIDFLQRAGGAAGSVKITGTQMAALGSTLLTLGESADTSGTSVKAIFVKLGSAEKGTKKFRSAMAQLGLNLRDVQKGMQVDAQGTLLKVLDKVRALPKDQQIGALTQIVGLEHAGTLAKLANGLEEYRKQIDMANSTGAQGSMAREFSARLQTTTAQWEILKNRTTEFAVNLGATVLPKINELTGSLGSAVSMMTDWSAKSPGWASALVGVAEAVGIASAAFGIMTTGLGGARYAFNALKLAMIANPLGAAIALLATAAVMIYQNWEPIKLFFQGLWITVGEGIDYAIGKLAWLGTAWRAFKGALGFGGGDGPSMSVDNTNMSSAEIPPMASMANRGTVNAQTTNNITLNQQIGENSADFMRRLRAELDRQAQIKKRGLTFDPAGAQ